MTDDVLADLITAIVAARADGDGVLTIAAVRARLAAAKIEVRRMAEESDNDKAAALLAASGAQNIQPKQ